MTENRTPFSDPAHVASYAEGPVRQVPGFHDLQKMAALLLIEKAPEDANILVVGAGGGLELKVFSEMQPHWRFCGVDPSSEMLQLAKQTLGSLATRTDFHTGYVDTAPERQFDAASCLLTLHFIEKDERLRTLREINRRLKPGAPLVIAHHSFPQGENQKDKWLRRYAAFAQLPGTPPENTEKSIATMRERLPTLSPEDDEALLRDAGFGEIELFYAGFTFKGWVACKP